MLSPKSQYGEDVGDLHDDQVDRLRMGSRAIRQRHRSARDYHTRFGWWVMTHDRGGPVVLGCITLAVFVGAIVWIVIWRGRIDGAFGWGLLAGGLLLPLTFFVARAIDVIAPSGDRDSARRNAAMTRAVFTQMIVALFALQTWLGGDAFWGVLLAEAALTALFMAVMSFRDALHTPHRLAEDYRAN